MNKKTIRALFLIMTGAVFISCNNINEGPDKNNTTTNTIDERYIGTYKTNNNDVLIVTKDSVSFNGTSYSINDIKSPAELKDEYPCKFVYTRSSQDNGSGIVWRIDDWSSGEPILVDEYSDPEDCRTYQYRDVIYSEEEWNQKTQKLDFNEHDFYFLKINVNLDCISANRKHAKDDNRKSLIKVDENKYIFLGYSSIELEIYENKSIDLYKTKTVYQFRGYISDNKFQEYTTKGDKVYDLYKEDDLERRTTGEKDWLEKTFDEPYKTVERLSCTSVYFNRQIEKVDDDDNKSDDENINSDEDISVAGKYTFANATPPQMNGSISLSDGKWSYSGEKSSPAASSGTYTVSKNKITVKWNASGNEVSETFTITESGSESTWKSDNSGVSTFFSMLFGVMNLEMTFTKS